jgi:hypothetical protein
MEAGLEGLGVLSGVACCRPAVLQVPLQEEYNRLAIQLAFLVACLYTGVGVFRLGFVTNFLSHAVIGGFTSGAAITIGLSQVRLAAATTTAGCSCRASSPCRLACNGLRFGLILKHVDSL